MNNEPSNTSQNLEEEINLKELVTVLLDAKKLIAMITIVVLVLASVYNFFVLDTSYKNSSTIIVETKESVETPYGVYELPYRTLAEYMRLVDSDMVLGMTAKELGGTYTSNGISNRIDTKSISEGRAFTINVQGSDSEEVYNIIKVHTENYVEYLYYDLTTKALDYLYNANDNNVNILEKNLEKNQEDILKVQELLENTPETVELDNFLITGQSIKSQEVHPSYTLIVSKLTELEIEKNDLVNSMELAKDNMEELEKEKEELEGIETAPGFEDLNTGTFQAVKNLVKISEYPRVESEEVSPNYLLNFVIAIVLGLMAGVFVVFFKDYWKKN